MVIEIVPCRHCQSNNVIKHGRDKRAIQRFRCRDCGRTFQKPEADRGYTPAFRAQVLAAYQERASMRGVSRIFGISRITLGEWLKKSQDPAAAGPDVEARPAR
jgi:transposase-like protein